MRLSRRQALARIAALFAAAGTPAAALPAAPGAWREEFAAALQRDRRLLGWRGVAQNELRTAQAALTGRIPPGLAGVLWRNGPARYERGGRRYHHWFDGDGMIQAWRIGPGGVSHHARFVETPKFRAEQQAGRFLWNAFGTRIAGARPADSPDAVNAANISVLEHGGELLALWEAGSAWRIDRETLQTLGPKVWGARLAGLPFSAHPKVDANGTLWSFGYDTLAGALVFYRIGADGAVQKTGLLRGIDDLAPGRFGMVHDFAVTQKHIVMLLTPLVFYRERLEAGFSFLDAHAWRDDLPLRALVLDKEDFSLRHRHELPPGFFFHIGNAFEDRAGIWLDMFRSDDAQALFGVSRDVMRGKIAAPAPAGEPRYAGIHLPLTGNGARVESGDNAAAAGEFPVIASGLAGRRNRHVWHLASAAGEVFFRRVARRNMLGEIVDSFDYGPGVLAEEHVFVPHPPRAGDESAGWLLGTALDTARQVTALHIFDAHHLAAGPLAVAQLEYPLPLGLHGWFSPAPPA